jgi:hypothetical protein
VTEAAVAPVYPTLVPAQNGRSSPLWRWITYGILGLYLVLSYSYVWTIQPGYGPDEPRHLAFVRRLVTKRQLPILDNGAEADGAIVLHPPLYYTAVAPVYALTRGLGDQTANRIIKHLSPLVLLGALLLFWSALRRVFPDQPFIVASALAVTALLPEYLLEAAVMNNDCFAVFFGGLWLWFLVRTWDEAPNLRTALFAGLIMAGFVSSKATGWFLTPLWALALLLRARNQPTPSKSAWLRDFAVGYGALLALGTWWYIRNWLLYHKIVPIEVEYMGQSLQPYDLRTRQPLSPIEVYTSGYVLNWGWRAVEGLFQSYWSQIDWLHSDTSFDLRTPIWSACGVLLGLAALGWVCRAVPWVAALRKRKSADGPTSAPRHSPLVLFAVAFALLWLTTWYTATFVHIGFYQGSRYLMPVSFAGGLLLARGWSALCPRKAQAPVTLAVVVGMVALNIVCLNELITYLNPKYVH